MFMKRKNLYITGDSFCFYRQDINNHWPAKLAQMLDLTLQGHGYPGCGWWPSRVDLFKYAQTKQFKKTDIFVICHTDIYRSLTGNPGWAQGYNQDLNDFYIKYLSDYDFNTWCSINWYKELNQLLKDKTVVHLHCFTSNQDERSYLEGIHISTELVQLSKFSQNNELSKMNHSCNHFTDNGNFVFAEMVYNSILQKSDQVNEHAFDQAVYYR